MRQVDATMSKVDGQWVITGRWSDTTIAVICGENIPEDMAEHLRQAVEAWMRGNKKKGSRK